MDHLQALRLTVAEAKLEANEEEEEDTLNMVRGLCAKYREQRRAAELGRVAAKDTSVAHRVCERVACVQHILRSVPRRQERRLPVRLRAPCGALGGREERKAASHR